MRKLPILLLLSIASHLGAQRQASFDFSIRTLCAAPSSTVGSPTTSHNARYSVVGFNHGYTSEILNLPQNDTLSYRQSSPIYFAEGLEDPLRMAHGMVDTNVHFHYIGRLTERLIELGKTRWELAASPMEDHAFVRPSSWADEYRRIF